MDGDNNVNPGSLVSSDTLFKPTNWLAKIDFINQLVLQNNVLLTVLTEHGGGKTSFSRLLKQEIDASVQAYVYKATRSFSSKDLLTKLGNIFHIKVDASTTMINMVEHINQQNKHVLLIIDDAQNLPPVFLQEIMMNIKRFDERMFFHICLMSDFKILKHLHQLEAGKFGNLIHTIELGTLTERETNTWVLNRANGASGINNSKLEEFYHLTGGSVARINSQMDGFFGIQRSLSVAKIKKIVTARMGQVASVLFVLVLVNFFWKTNQYSSVTTKNTEIKVQQTAQNLKSKTVEAALQSTIPVYSLASTVQSLQPSSRNLVIDYGDNEENELGNLVLMDKVVVLPSLVSADRSDVSGISGSLLPSIGKLALKNAVVKKTDSLYTIQLLASKHLNELEKFVATQDTHNQFKIAHTNRKGIDWYVLTMGDFGKRALAQQAIDKLPANIAKFKPWVRSAKELKVIG